MADVARTTERSVALDTGVTVHYVTKGRGTPVVFIHGGGRDYRYWNKQIDSFAERYRVVAYSRRYAPPNDNREIAPNYTRSDAGAWRTDRQIDLRTPRRCMIARRGLVLAVQEPELVRSPYSASPGLVALDSPDGVLNRFLTDASYAARRFARRTEARWLDDLLLVRGRSRGFPSRSRKVMHGARLGCPDDVDSDITDLT